MSALIVLRALLHFIGAYLEHVCLAVCCAAPPLEDDASTHCADATEDHKTSQHDLQNTHQQHTAMQQPRSAFTPISHT